MRNEDLMDDNEGIQDDTEKEAIELLKSQYDQIQQLKSQLNNKSKTIKMLEAQNKNLMSQVKNFEDNNSQFARIKAQFDTMYQEKEHLRSQLYEKTKITEELQSDFKEISKKFNALNDKLINQEDTSNKVTHLVELVRQYSKELTESTQKNKYYENELTKLNREMSTIMQQDQKLQIEHTKSQDALNDEITTANKDIGLLCQWMDNYLGVYYDNQIEIPDIPTFYNKKINFQLLGEKIINARKRINEYQSQNENTLQQLQSEQIEILTKLERTNKQLGISQNENLLLKDEIARIFYNKEQLENMMNKTQLDIIKKENSISEYLSKLNAKMNKFAIKINDIKENLPERETKEIFEGNLNILINYTVQLENQNNILTNSNRNSISRDELATVKSFYQSQISALENDVKKNVEIIKLYKEDNERLNLQIEQIEKEKNNARYGNIMYNNQNHNQFI